MLETEFRSTNKDLDYIHNASDAVTTRIINWKYYPEPFFRWTSLHEKVTKAHNYYEEIIDKIMAKKREELSKKEIVDERNNNLTVSFIRKLLTTEIHGRKLTDQEVNENLKTIILTVRITWLVHKIMKLIFFSLLGL